MKHRTNIRAWLRTYAISMAVIWIGIGMVLAVQETQGRMISDVMEGQAQIYADLSILDEPQPPQPEDLPEGSLGKFEITYYDMNCETCQTDSVCANGENGVPFVTLAAPPEIPFGTRLKLVYTDGSYRIGVVMDRGGAIKGDRIDVMVETHAQALKLGRDVAEVIIID